MNVKVSVIVPIYNVQEYLEECLNSIINQNLNDIEVICVNDQSTDKSVEIVEKYIKKFDFIKLINNKTNRGLSYSRNRGLEIAKGKYVLFLDSDDYLKENALLELYQNAEDLATDILYFDKEIIYDINYDGAKDFVPDENLEYGQIYTGMELFVECAKIRSFKSINAYTQFFKLQFLAENNLKFYDGIVHEDLLFYFLCVIKAKRVTKIKKSLYIYRKRNGSITEKISESRKQSIFIVLVEIWNIWKNKKYSESENFGIKIYMEMIYGSFLKYQQELGNDENLSYGNEADLFLYKVLMKGTVSKKFRYISFDKQELNKIYSSSSIWVYGAGTVGSEVAIFLDDNRKQIKGFIVSNDLEENKKLGWPVYQVDKVSANKRDLIIISVTHRLQKEIYLNLKKHGFENIMFAVKPSISEEGKPMIREHFLPIHKIDKGAKVILYGAGKVGKVFWNRNSMLNWCNIFMVVDTYYDNISNFPVEVVEPNKIKDENDYDYILVSVVNEKIKKEIIENLIKIGVSKDAIIDGTGCYLEYETKDINLNDLNLKEDVLKIGFHPGGVMGDNIISLKLYQEIVKIAPKSKVDIFTTFTVFPEIVFHGQKNLNMFIHHAPQVEDFCNYDLIIQSHYEPSIVYYNKERVANLCPELAQRIDILEQYQENELVNCSVAQYMNRIQWDRAKFKNWNCYTLLGSSGAFEINDTHIDFKLNPSFKKIYDKLELTNHYITFNYGASDPLKNGKLQTKMWPYEYHEELNRLLKNRFPQIELVQVGAADVTCVSGADRYILGENLEVTKYILKNAICHFDCEGGLVHIATQLGAKCFVVFGPTPVGFFGYSTNTNIVSKVCGECCGMIRDWYTRCYKYDRPECMYSILPEDVFISMEKYISKKICEENLFSNILINEINSKVRICAELTGGLGDYIITKKLIQAILNIDSNIDFTLLGRVYFLKPVYFDIPQCNKLESGELKEFDNENYDVTIRITHVIEVKYFDDEKMKKKSKALYQLFKNLIETKESYFLYNRDQSYIDAVNLKRAKFKGLNRYTMLRHNNLLEINDKRVALSLNKDFEKEFKSLGLGNFITINRGADTRSKQRNQTKIWPLKHYNELIVLLKNKYPQYEIIQLGIEGDEKLDGVDKYIFGRDIEIVKYILFNAVLHIDSEGGLVHMATQLGTKCTVVFGPTPVDYYGYEQNINIVARDCNECMGVSTDWFLHCYKGYEQPQCMESICAFEVFTKIEEFLNTRESKNAL